MATIFEDDFNSYNDGDLNGQGSWSGDVGVDIQGILVQEGAKAVKVIGDTGNQEIIKTGTARTDGRISFYQRRDYAGEDTYSQFQLYQGATLVTGCRLNITGGIDFLVSGGWVAFDSYSADTWYLAEIEWRSSDTKVRMRIDGGTWGAWSTPYASWSTGLDKVRMVVTNSGATCYWDYIHEGSYDGPTDLKSINSIAKSDIKSINGIAIASVKSVNTIT